MLEVKNIHAAYGPVKVLNGVSFNVQPGEIRCLLGRNGAGKTTIMKSIMGLLRVSEGSVNLDDENLSALPAHLVPRRGIGYIPQGRRLFAELSVYENIEIGLMARHQGEETREWVLDLFPRLRATARALCLRPKVLLLDEPTEGLQPSMIEQIRQVIVKMKEEGFAIVLVEQRVDAVLSIADHVTFIEGGKDIENMTAAALKEDPSKQRKYLGV